MATYRFPYLSPHQSREREPTEWEVALADAMEAAFGRGVETLPGLVEALNASRVKPRLGGSWTEDNLTAQLRELGA